MSSSFPVMGHVMGHPAMLCLSLYLALDGATPHGASIAATHRGTAPAQALTGAGSIGCSRQAGPPALYQHASPKQVQGPMVRSGAGRLPRPRIALANARLYGVPVRVRATSVRLAESGGAAGRERGCQRV